MKKFFSTVLASLLGSLLAGAVLLILSIVIFFATMSAMMTTADGEDVEKIKEHTILALDLNTKIIDKETFDPFENWNFPNLEIEQTTGLKTILKNIEKAKTDENIDGIFLKLSSIDAGISTVEEIRNALIDFKGSGKFIISHADGYSHKTYYLASVADKIYLTPTGGLDFFGLSAQVLFYKKALESLGIEPIILRHGKFKSAVEPFMLDKMSEANREQLSTFIGSIWHDLISKISDERKIDTARLNEIADELMVKNATSCVELGLIDSLKYYDELLAVLQSKTGAATIKDIEFTSISKYAKVPKKREKDEKGLAKDKIAVIFASGEIVMGNGDGKNIGAESLARTIREIRRDDDIKAIVLRINSPGGSALASEIIWREVKLAKETKPLIVSMGDYAASGGYYIACAADTIVASPNTLTGSIGVFGLTFNIQKLMNEKIGITSDKVNTNKYSDIGSVTRKMDKEEQTFLLSSIEEIYSVFIQHVADGRGLTTEKVDEIGQGRIWSGINAKKLGLVDELGGLNKAIEIAAAKAKLDRFRIVDYPKKKDPFQALIEKLGGSVKTNAIENELGEFAAYYRLFKNMTLQKGVQARLPMEISIN